MFREVADLYHDLDDGMRPISVIFPYLPTAFHRRRDAARTQLHAIFSKVIVARRASGVKEDDMLQVRAGVGGGVGWVGVGVGQAWPGLFKFRLCCIPTCAGCQPPQSLISQLAAWQAAFLCSMQLRACVDMCPTAAVPHTPAG